MVIIMKHKIMYYIIINIFFHLQVLSSEAIILLLLLLLFLKHEYCFILLPVIMESLFGVEYLFGEVIQIPIITKYSGLNNHNQVVLCYRMY
jgi:hypothetical protein